MSRLIVLVSVLSLAACGDDDPVRHLDGGIDSMIDAPNTPQPVTLTVTRDGLPQENVRVYFVGPDSSLISNAVTDSTGVATALMPSGGYVSAVNPFNGAQPAGIPTASLYTFAGVKSGDHLKLTDRGAPGTSVTVTAAVDADPSVTQYMFSSPCGQGFAQAPGSAAQPSATFDLSNDCTGATDFVVASLDDAGEIVHWIYASNVTIAAQIDLTGMALTNAPSTKTYTINNANDFGFQMQVTQSLVSTRGEVVTREGTANGKGSPFTLTMKNPNFANAVDIVQATGFTTANGIGTHTLVDWSSYSTAYTVDAGARYLADLTAAPSLDTTAHTLTWTTGNGVAPDFVLAFGYAFHTNFGFDWTIAAPYGSSVQFPTLPTDVGDFTIGADDDASVVGIAFGKVPGGYDAVRATLFSTNGPQDLVTSATGSITIETWNDTPRLARTSKAAAAKWLRPLRK